MKKKITALLAVLCCMGNITLAAEPGWETKYIWAKNSVNYCAEKNILQGDENGNYNLGNKLTRSEMAKVIAKGLGINTYADFSRYSDVSDSNWAFNYIKGIQEFIADEATQYRPFDYATREEFISCIMYAMRVDLNVPKDNAEKFSDFETVSECHKSAVSAAVYCGYVKGDENKIRPKDALTRAEACVLFARILEPDLTEIQTQSPIPQGKDYVYSETPIMDKSQHTMEQAVAWAQKRGAAQCFIDVAPYYWYYGDVFGIRADVMYAQAAKETNFGKYTGKVKPEMNNWAGIKKYGAVGDETDDHETFATPDDGVRGHFNHMSAYVGVEPVGETHGRYKSVRSLAWAGTVKFVEQLGGKWCPDINYGYSIMNDYVNKMG